MIKKSFYKLAVMLALGVGMLACQQTDENKQETTVETSPATEVTPVVEKRPAPEFYVIPPDIANKRVWICENATADIFHIKHDCPVLVQCKGNGTFRNLPLHRAIEDYGRYNCQTCSKELDHIFDEDMVR